MRTTKKSQANSKNHGRDAAIQIMGKQTNQEPQKMNLFESITAKIITILEKGEANGGTISWAGQGATAGLPRNLKTGAAYRGVNVLLLWAACQENGYTSPSFLTFQQARALGGSVRKGEKAVQGVYWGLRDVKEENAADDEEAKKTGFAKAFFVFNVEQCDGLTIPDTIPAGNVWEAHAAAEALIKASGARITESGDKAFYRSSTDEIYMPTRDRFSCPEDFYAVNLHELSHWTGHASRLNRSLANRFGDAAYAAEELIAELSSAFLSAETGINGKLEGHASYIASWLRLLKSDPRAIVTAASAASKAANFLISGAKVEEKAAA